MNKFVIHEVEDEAEKRRVAALHSYDVLDTPPEEIFDRITRLGQTILQAPTILISLIDSDRQWFKSRINLDAAETARDISFCTHAIRQNEPFIIPDATADIRFKDNPLVIGSPHIRFYMGIPLCTHDGYRLGTICSLDSNPRRPTDTQIAAFQDLSKLIMDLLELRRIAAIDSLTGAMTRRVFLATTDAEIARTRRYGRDLSLIIIDVDRFKSINDTHGHPAGDDVLREIARVCKAGLRENDSFARIGGDEFIILMPETSVAGAELIAHRLQEALHGIVLNYRTGMINVTSSFGITSLTDADTDAAALISCADMALYDAKRAGRDRISSLLAVSA